MFLYIWISLVDLIICLLSFASAVSDFSLGSATMFGNTHFCNMVFTVLHEMSPKMSVFISLAHIKSYQCD